MTKVFDFKEQLKIGDAGEQLLLEHYKGPKLSLFPGREYDFDRADGLRVELKSDSYKNSRNFFFERYSDYEKKKPGSVWQSVGKADVFVYMFVNERVYYEFSDLPLLLSTLDDITRNMYAVLIRNKGWTASGYKVPRSKLEHLYQEVRL